MHGIRTRGSIGTARLTLLLVAAFGCVAGLTPDVAQARTKPLTGIPLVWKATTSFEDLKIGAVDLTPFGNVKIELEPLTDARTRDKSLIGENHEDEAKGKVLQVTTKDDVLPFCTTHLKETLAHFGLPIVDGKGTVRISGEVVDFFVVEKDTYVGDVRIKLTVKDSGGKVLWSGIGGGSATRFGRSYKADNYMEALSDSLLEAAAQLLRSSDFLHAAAGKK